MMRLNWLLGLVLVLMLVPTHSKAQEVCDSISEDAMIIDSVYTATGEIVADTFYLGDYAKCKDEIPQYELKELDWVELCPNPRYAIVFKGTQQGIYDMFLHMNLTKIEYDKAVYFHQTESDEDSDIIINLFLAKKGNQTGMLGISEYDNSITELWMDETEVDSEEK